MITKKDGVFFYYIADYFRSEHKLQIELILLLPMFQMFPNNYAHISSLGNLRFSDKHRKISQVNGGVTAGRFSIKLTKYFPDSKIGIIVMTVFRWCLEQYLSL